MSNVNQAFLRAYIKNRAATELPATQSNGMPSELPDQIHPQSPLQPQLPSNENPLRIRVDRRNDDPRLNSSVPIAASAIPTPSDDPNGTKSGYWSPLGVERGMKGTVTNSGAPAVVKNARAAVPLEATVQRLDRPHTQKQQTAPSNPNANALSGARNTTLPVQAPLQASVNNPPRPITQPPSQASSQSNQVSRPNVPPAAVYRQGSAPENFVKQRAPALKLPSQNAESANNSVAHTHTDQTPNHAHGSQQSDGFDVGAKQESAPKSIYYPPQTRVDQAESPVMRGPHFREERPSSSNSTSNTAVSDQQRHSRQTTNKQSTNSRHADIASLQHLPLPVAFAPSWEVDNFFWPEVVTRLEESNSNAFRQIGLHLAQVNQAGLKVMAISSGERGVGRSTVAMHLARAAASAGLKVALIDADALSPSLCDQLRLDIEHGWQNCLFEAVPLEEAAVHSIADRVTLFPLTSIVSQQQLHANLHRMAKLIRRISTAFDMVFLDSCRLNLDQRDLVGVSNEIVIDAAVLVVDTELSVKEKIDSAISILQTMGLGSIGLIENFRA